MTFHFALFNDLKCMITKTEKEGCIFGRRCEGKRLHNVLKSYYVYCCFRSFLEKKFRW